MARSESASAVSASAEAHKTLLRFITCGSVDDGKSSLIGRLLFDTKLILDDQLKAITRDSRKHGTVGEDVDLALLVDGLEAEREQGITIDVAYRFFSTPKRSFIVADTPGHEQYTRNMATGASTADLAILLVDAQKGLLTQTRRHSIIASLLGIRHIVLAVNKIDRVGFSGSVFHQIVSDFLAFAGDLGFSQITPIPLSARYGDNVSSPSDRTPWYDGKTLLSHLESVSIGEVDVDAPLRFPVQLVNRPNSSFRGYCGTVAAGRVAVGDRVVIASSGKQTSVTSIVAFEATPTVASAGDAVTLVLADEVDIARGDMICGTAERPEFSDQFAADLVWMDEHDLIPGRSYLLRIGTKTVPARVTTLKYKLDVNALEERPAKTLGINEIGVVNLHTSAPVAFDPYRRSRRTGSFILIDRTTNATVGGGMIRFGLRRATNIHRHDHIVSAADRARALNQRPLVLWFTGLSGSGKSTIANLVEKELHLRGLHTVLLDGDNVRHGINRDLGFTEADRAENIRRVGEITKLFTEAGLIVLCCFISPYAAERQSVRELHPPGTFVEVFVDASLDQCIARDPKGLYKRALNNEIANFTGLSSPYERPVAAEVTLAADTLAAEVSARMVVEAVIRIQEAD